MPKAVKSTTTVEPKVAAPKAEKAPKVAKINGLNVPVYSLAGKEAGTLDLPQEIFGAPVNKQILSQAVRVYQTNSKGHWGHTKTRGEVVGSTRKLGAQKGSGNARHGSIMSPIFVGGGIALGPRRRNVRLELPKRMKKLAVISALSAKAVAGEVVGIDGLDKAAGKTKEFVALLKATERKNVLIVTGEKQDTVVRALRNIQGSDATYASQLNALEILSHRSILFTKEAISKLVTISEQNKAEEAQ